MKKYSILLSAASVIFALASCQKAVDEEPITVEEGSVPFELVANFADPATQTKTALNLSTWKVDWEEGDIIYAVTTDEAWGEPYPSENDAAAFTYSSATEKFTTDKAIADGSHTFNFLYTPSTQKSYHRGASSTFQLYTNQTYDVSDPTANLKTYDALAGQATVTTPTSFVDVEMSHLFTLMKVTIKNKTGADLTATKFEITAKSGTYLYGVFDVTFGATPSVSYNKNGGNTIGVNIANGAIANNGTIDVYLVMAPLNSYTGDITFKVTDSASKTYSRTNSISSAITLAAGTYNSATHTLVDADPAETVLYSCGFESSEGFTTGTNYKSTVIGGPTSPSKQWEVYYGNFSTSSKITGSASVALRRYSSDDEHGYAEMKFDVTGGPTKVTFNAKAAESGSAKLKLTIEYSTDSGGSWTTVTGYSAKSLTSSAAPYEFSVAGAPDKYRLRFSIDASSTKPTSGNAQMTIDDITIIK